MTAETAADLGIRRHHVGRHGHPETARALEARGCAYRSAARRRRTAATSSLTSALSTTQSGTTGAADRGSPDPAAA
ncbi:hypothetical protein Sxan_00820 [Streptomyces xanthophaeus]|uniref:Uncharacterized protein n=1 Tax=Streptomyces xanthophaeus TaxID=67385 RepID=A0A919GX09_9ACTN|nr:hypothetical protein Sxan_00820 [Streptomyces xanthophaeus]